MKHTMTPLLVLVLAGLMLSACDKATEPAAVSAPDTEGRVVAAPLARNLDSDQIVRGRAIYDNSCAECHGVQGKGPVGDWRVRDADGMFPPPPLDDSAHAWHHPTVALLQTIREGSPQGMGNMPAWKDKLSEQDMQDVVEYIKSLWSDPVYEQWMKLEQQSLGG